jgi:ATP-binding cassette, subfamily B, bacterial
MTATTASPPRRGRHRAEAGRGVLPVLRRAAAIAPSLRRGLGLTLFLALLGTAGQVVVPIAVQQVLDREVLGADTIDP